MNKHERDNRAGMRERLHTLVAHVRGELDGDSRFGVEDEIDRFLDHYKDGWAYAAEMDKLRAEAEAKLQPFMER